MQILENLPWIGAGVALIGAFIFQRKVMSCSPGNDRMQELAKAIQEGARAYLNRQYKTIAVVGIIILIIITYALGIWVGLGFFIGAFLSGACSTRFRSGCEQFFLLQN